MMTDSASAKSAPAIEATKRTESAAASVELARGRHVEKSVKSSAAPPNVPTAVAKTYTANQRCVPNIVSTAMRKIRVTTHTIDAASTHVATVPTSACGSAP